MSATERTCPNGHTYFKSTDCPTCPQCEKEKVASDPWFNSLSAPAIRALKNAGIHDPIILSQWRKKDLLALHGFGPSSIPKIEKILSENGLSLSKDDASA